MADSSEFIKIEAEEGSNTVHAVVINPDQIMWGAQNQLYGFALLSGAWVAKRILVWASSLDEALEEAVHGAAEGAATGFVYDDAQYMEQMEEVAKDLGYPSPTKLSWEEDSDKLQEMEEWTGLHYTESGYYDTEEWAGWYDKGQLERQMPALYEAAVVGSLEVVFLADLIEEIDDVPREYREIFVDNFDLED